VLAGLVHRVLPPYFPYGTFLVNVVGCLAFGAIFGLSEQRFVVGPTARAFLLIGLLGGFTTFSSFTFETFQLLRDGEFLLATANAGGQLVLGLVAFWLGLAASRLV
jgi:fluoride exporter